MTVGYAKWEEQHPVATVDVAIVNWNTSKNAIASAQAYAESRDVDARVVIFDNASVPEQRSILRSLGGVASVILNDENLGFGTAANRALEGGTAEFVLVSNADVLPEETAVGELVRAFTTTSNCGIAAPVLGSAGYHDELPGPLTLLFRIPVGGFNRKSIRSPNNGEIVTVGQPAGACFLTSRAVWEQVGGFDERFFLWYEDVDLARRLHDLGKTSVITGSARVQHPGGKSFTPVSKRTQQRLRLDSLGLYLRLHHPILALIAFPLLFVVSRVRT